jgi:hypothetical protein
MTMMFSVWLIACVILAGVSSEHPQRGLHWNEEIAPAIEEQQTYPDAEPSDLEAQSSVDAVFVPLGRTSFWRDSSVPGTPETTDTASVTLGLRFSSDVPGTVIGIRFYKGPHNTGIHVGDLWSSAGSKLATVTFSAETPSGWQQALFSSPINITAKTTYVISYLAPNGQYACDQNYAWTTLSAAQLHVSGVAPAVFAYGSASTFPSATWNASNYWVDLVFAPSTSSNLPDLYTISGSVSGPAATLSLSGAANRSTTADTRGGYTFAGLPSGTYVVTATQPGYTFIPPIALVTVRGADITGVNFRAAQVPAPHYVTLNWSASISSSIVGYNVYRGRASGGPYAQIGFTGGTAYVDTNVSSGQTYFYVVTAIDSRNEESKYSSQATAIIPTP